MATQPVWWHRVSTEIQEFVEKCSISARHRSQGAEPLITTIPQLPWQKLAADVFELNGQLYLLVVYYYSKYVEVAYMSTMSCRQTIDHFRSIFARNGIPEELTMAVYFGRICQFCCRSSISTHHQQSSVPTGQWFGRTYREVSQTIVLYFKRPMECSFGLSLNSFRVWI